MIDTDYDIEMAHRAVDAPALAAMEAFRFREHQATWRAWTGLVDALPSWRIEGDPDAEQSTARVTVGWPGESRAEARARRLRALGFEVPTKEQLARFALTRIP